ncbi:MAG: hypothetical protein V3R99_12050, partial [Thermoguttaceae bacterium]
MVDGDTGELRSIAWAEIFPWLSILRTFRMAISLRVLVFSAVGALLTVSGWALIAWVFSGDPDVAKNSPWLEQVSRCPWTLLTGEASDGR